jgi:hypothetical protein
MQRKIINGRAICLAAASIVILISLMSAHACAPECGAVRTTCWTEQYNIRETSHNDWWQKSDCYTGCGGTRYCIWKHYERTCWKYDVDKVCQKKVYCCKNGVWELDGNPTRTTIKKNVPQCKTSYIGLKTLPQGQKP